jgi:hypothetical protein
VKHIIGITAWRRPEFFLAAMRSMLVADRPDVHYLIRIDHDPHPNVLWVADWFADRVRGRVDIRLAKPYDPVTNGLANLPDNNVLSMMHETLGYDAEYYHCTEDDVLVSRDYFGYHESAHALHPYAFNATACSLDLQHEPGPLNFHLARDSVRALNVAASYRRPVLEEALRYLPLDYLKDPIGHLARTFPNADASSYWGIDGALGRTRNAMGRSCVVPVIGRAYHIGYIGARCWPICDLPVVPGYPHRHGPQVEGTLMQQAQKLMTMTAEEYNERAEMKDHVVYDLGASFGPVTVLLS